MKKITLSMLIAFTTITVNAQNKLLSSIQEYNNNGTWEKSYGTNYEYDSNNNLIAETGLSWADGVWKRSSIETYSYNASNKLTEDTYENWNPETNEVDYKGRSIYSYTDGRLTAIEGQEWKDSNWLNEYKVTATYNSNNLPEVVIEYSWISSQWVNEERTTYTYNANNKIISSVFEEWINAQWVNSEKTINTYNTNNKLILSRDADWDDFNNDWTQNGNKIELMWDITGNKTQNIDYYSWQGTVNQYKNEYTYDSFAMMSSYAHPFKDKTGVDYLEEDFPFVNKILSEDNFSYDFSTNSYVNSYRTIYNYNNSISITNVPVEEQEYLALVELYNQLNGNQWTNKWEVTSNNLHSNKWFGVTTFEGHIVAINLNSNNVSGILPNIFDQLPFLNKLSLFSNKITGIAAILPSSIDFVFDSQTIELGEIDLNVDTVIKDLSINRYEHAKQGFYNQTYNLRIGSFSKTVTIPEEGIKLMDLMTTWNVPDNQNLELRQISGDAKNSIINYTMNFKSGDSNLDSKLNVLDIQTTVNYIMNNPIYYFNYNATDVNFDTKINVLDIIGQVKIIQNQGLIAPNGKNAKSTQKDSEVNAKISIENGLLFLDTNGKEVASFEILMSDASKVAIEELISPLGFTVNFAEKNNKVSIIAYAFNAKLNGKIALAKLSNSNPIILSVLLSDSNAVEISSEIMATTLGTQNVEREEPSKTYNFPNPFTEETTIEFFATTDGIKTTLSVYDMSGKKVSEMAIERPTKGQNQFKFKRKDLASGLYFYVLQSEDSKDFFKGKMTIK